MTHRRRRRVLFHVFMGLTKARGDTGFRRLKTRLGRIALVCYFSMNVQCHGKVNFPKKKWSYPIVVFTFTKYRFSTTIARPFRRDSSETCFRIAFSYYATNITAVQRHQTIFKLHMK